MKTRHTAVQANATTNRTDNGAIDLATKTRFNEATAATIRYSIAVATSLRIVSGSIRSAMPRTRMASRTSQPPTRVNMNSGRPLIGLRTASHAFDTRGKAPEGYSEWRDLDPTVLGGNYHGHHGSGPICTVTFAKKAKRHPILAGVSLPFTSNGSLYEVRPLGIRTRQLLIGSIPGKEPEPVAWTNRYGKSRVFYTSLGHPDDFRNEHFRRLLINAVFGAMKKPVPD